MKLLRSYVLYPIGLAIYPVFSVFAANLKEIPASLFVRPLTFFFAISILIYWSIQYKIRDWNRSGFLSALLVVGISFYGVIARESWRIAIIPLGVKKHLLLFPIWLIILTFFGSSLVWKRVKNPGWLTQYLNIVVLITLVIPITQIGYTVLHNIHARNPESSRVEIEKYNLDDSYSPDIYYLIIDGYGRSDVLGEVYNLNNDGMMEFLKSKGFFIAEESHANYLQTTLSLASSLNMKYLTGFPQDSTDRAPLRAMIRDSQVRRMLQEIGYDFVVFYSGYIFTDIRDADVYLSPFLNTVRYTELEGLLLLNSIAVILIDMGFIENPLSGFEAQRIRIEYPFETLINIPTYNSPKFIFAHIGAPHPPFVFQANGKPTDMKNPAYLAGMDGSDFPGTREEYIHAYREQLQYINTLLIRTINGILENSSNPPIIILQSDHGPGAYYNSNSAQDTCTKERAGILNAYYFPDNDYETLYESISPVNSFRVIFNTLFETNYMLLDDNTYYSTLDFPYEFVDVTKSRSESCGKP